MSSNRKKIETENYKFMRHEKCEFFPCHDTGDSEGFNCLFCYCPLYALGNRCGGNFVYTENGIKDCSNCMIPHRENAYEYIMDKSKLLIELAREK